MCVYNETLPNLYEATEYLSYIRDLVLLDPSGEYDETIPLKDQLTPLVELSKSSKTQMGDPPPSPVEHASNS
jgi:hypothetical protein